MRHRRSEAQAYAAAEGNAVALARAWAEGWRARGFDRPDAVNPYDGTHPNAEHPEA